MKRLWIGIVFIVLAIVAAFLLPLVNVNYDMTKYLPDDKSSSQGIELIADEFGETSTARFMFDEGDIEEAIDVKTDIEAIDDVLRVTYVDDVLNQLNYQILRSQMTPEQQSAFDTAMNTYLTQGYSFTMAFYQVLESMPQNPLADAIADYYDDAGYSLFEVTIGVAASSSEAETATQAIETYLQDEAYTVYAGGDTISTQFMNDTVEDEVFWITLILVPLILVLLVFLSISFADVLVYLIGAGVAIVLNLGTNALLPDISFITQSMALALQLAISLDYIIFIVHAYHKAREKTDDTDVALNKAYGKIRRPVIASALTTGFSFLAFLIMRFTIGQDIGIVFAKAIFFSLVTALFFVPVLLKVFDSWMQKSKHKVFMPKFGAFAKFIYRFRVVFLVFLILIFPAAAYFQQANDFSYGESGFTGAEGSSYQINQDAIQEYFPENNNIVIIMPKDDALEGSIYQYLTQNEDVTDVTAAIYYKQVLSDPAQIAAATAPFYSDSHTLIRANLETEEEGEEAFRIYETLFEDIKAIDEDAHIVGSTPLAYDIKDTIRTDYNWVTVLAVVLIMIVIFLSFKNFLMPFLLPLVILASVYTTMSVPYFFNTELIFLGYLITSTILLGATIDYGILLAKRYIEIREDEPRDKSIQDAINDAAPSIVTSAVIFLIAGLSILFISSIASIQQMGLLIGIGAFVSMLFVLVMLPQLLYVLDKWIVGSKVNK